MYFVYGERETEYLKSRDKRLAEIIDRIGHIDRPVDDDLFSATVRHIIGQQISTKAQQSVWARITEELGTVDADTLLSCGRERLQSFGTTFRKADNILGFAEKVKSGAFDPAELWSKSDEEVTEALISLKGVGVWTAEMLMLFCMQRPDVFSYGDLGILRGLRMVYRHKEISRTCFERYRKRFSPYCSVASLYFWAVAGGAIPELSDPAAKRQAK